MCSQTASYVLNLTKPHKNDPAVVSTLRQHPSVDMFDLLQTKRVAIVQVGILPPELFVANHLLRHEVLITSVQLCNHFKYL